MENTAIYLDELSEEPEVACKLARDFGFSHVCIRRVWGDNISRVTDDNCKSLLASIKRHSLKTIAICTDVGRVPANEIGSQSLLNDFRRSLILTNYFHAKYIRVYAGFRTNKDSIVNIDQKVNTWMATVARESNDCGITPLLEADQDGYLIDPTPLSAALSTARTWRLLFDPAIIGLHKPPEYVLRYWHTFKAYVSCIDLHDHHPENGFVPVGSGTTRLPDIISDCLVTGYNGWWFVEPGSAKRRNNNNRSELCEKALVAFNDSISNIKKQLAKR